MNDLVPFYLQFYLQLILTREGLRSSMDILRLDSNRQYGIRSFSRCGLGLLKNVPLGFQNLQTVTVFKRNPKIHVFSTIVQCFFFSLFASFSLYIYILHCFKFVFSCICL